MCFLGLLGIPCVRSGGSWRLCDTISTKGHTVLIDVLCSHKLVDLLR